MVIPVIIVISKCAPRPSLTRKVDIFCESQHSYRRKGRPEEG